MTLDLNTIRGVVMDMDGVLWRGSDVIPGAPEFLNFLAERGIAYGLATNNSTRTVAEYVSRCQAMGLPARADQIITSSLVTATAMTRNYPPGMPIYVIGSTSLAEMLSGCGFEIDAATAKAVVVGLDVHLTYEKLGTALRRLLDGADFIATNADASIPTPDGLAPGAGSIVAALETASGRKALVMGKPQETMFKVAVERLGGHPAHTLMIGDRLDTDIAGAQQAGLRAALVLTGASRRDEIGTIQPDAVFADLQELRASWSAL
jgi:4-nitrophenyl phosphatase